jgi:hypothetical protein
MPIPNQVSRITSSGRKGVGDRSVDGESSGWDGFSRQQIVAWRRAGFNDL